MPLIRRYAREGMALGQPSIRIWELDEDSTRYDRMRAAPSDGQMHDMWTGWSTVFFIATLFNLVVFLAVVLKKKTRTNNFNQYLLGLMGPDILFTGICAVQCAFLAADGGYTHSFECRFQSFYLVWGMASNSWLNGVVAFEVHRLLRQSNRRQRYFPPSTRKVAIQSAAVYLWAVFIASWGVYSFPWLPHRTDSVNGLVCLPMEFDRASSLFFWLAFYPLMNAVPLAYGVWVTIDITRNGLLPPQGKKREIAVFFFRIVVVFVVMWLPSIVFFYAGSGINIWVVYFSGIWAHMQGAVSAAVSMLKSDIRFAVLDFLFCRTLKANRDLEAMQGSRLSSISWNLSRQGLGASSLQVVSASRSHNILVDLSAETEQEDFSKEMFKKGVDAEDPVPDAQEVTSTGKTSQDETTSRETAQEETTSRENSQQEITSCENYREETISRENSQAEVSVVASVENGPEGRVPTPMEKLPMGQSSDDSSGDVRATAEPDDEIV